MGAIYLQAAKTHIWLGDERRVDSRTLASLDENIRVLVLHPAENTFAPLQCNIIRVNGDDLDENQQYEAVSCCWGTPDFTRILT